MQGIYPTLRVLCDFLIRAAVSQRTCPRRNGAIVAKRLMELEKLKSGPSISKDYVANIDGVMRGYENSVLEVRAGYVTCFFRGKKKTGYIRDCEMDLLRNVPIWREQEGWTPDLVQDKTLWVEIGDICVTPPTNLLSLPISPPSEAPYPPQRSAVRRSSQMINSAACWTKRSSLIQRLNLPFFI